MFRIQIETVADGLSCRLAGRLDVEGAEEVRRVLSACAGVQRAELSDLRAADEAGLALLAELRAAGTELEGLSPFLSLRLAAVKPRRETSPDDASAGVEGGR